MHGTVMGSAGTSRYSSHSLWASWNAPTSSDTNYVQHSVVHFGSFQTCVHFLSVNTMHHVYWYLPILCCCCISTETFNGHPRQLSHSVSHPEMMKGSTPPMSSRSISDSATTSRQSRRSEWPCLLHIEYSCVLAKMILHKFDYECKFP